MLFPGDGFIFYSPHWRSDNSNGLVFSFLDGGKKNIRTKDFVEFFSGVKDFFKTFSFSFCSFVFKSMNLGHTLPFDL